MISKSDAHTLLVGAVTKAEVRDSIITTLHEPVFNTTLYFAHDFIWRAYRGLMDETTDVTPMLLAGRVQDMLDSVAMSSEESELIGEELVALFKTKVEEVPTDYCYTIIQSIRDEQTFRKTEDRLLDVLKRGKHGGKAVLTDLQKVVNEISSENDDADEDPYIHPLKHVEDLLVMNVKHSTGVAWLDELLGGGVSANKLWGFLGPSGGGKTTFTVQTAMGWIKSGAGRHAVIFSYEQPAEGDITERILSHVSGCSRDRLEGKRYVDLEPDIQEAISKNKARYEDNLHFLDFSKNGDFGMDGASDIENELRKRNLLIERSSLTEEQLQTTPPVLVFIDWLIPMVQRYMTKHHNGSTAVGSELRGIGTLIMDNLKVLKNKYLLSICVTHQLKPTAANASPSRSVEWGDAAEWGGFAWMLDDCVGVGNRTSEEIGIMATPKARSHGRSQIFVQLDGARCRFLDVSSSYTVVNGRFIKKEDEGVRSAPKGLKRGPQATLDKIRAAQHAPAQDASVMLDQL